LTQRFEEKLRKISAISVLQTFPANWSALGKVLI